MSILLFPFKKKHKGEKKTKKTDPVVAIQTDDQSITTVQELVVYSIKEGIVLPSSFKKTCATLILLLNTKFSS